MIFSHEYTTLKWFMDTVQCWGTAFLCNIVESSYRWLHYSGAAVQGCGRALCNDMPLMHGGTFDSVGSPATGALAAGVHSPMGVRRAGGRESRGYIGNRIIWAIIWNRGYIGSG